MISRGVLANDLTGGSAQKVVSGVEALDGAGPLGARGRGGRCCGIGRARPAVRGGGARASAPSKRGKAQNPLAQPLLLLHPVGISDRVRASAETLVEL